MKSRSITCEGDVLGAALPVEEEAAGWAAGFTLPGSTGEDALGSDARLAVIEPFVAEDKAEALGGLDAEAITAGPMGTDAGCAIGVFAADAVDPMDVLGADGVAPPAGVVGATAEGTVGVAGAGAVRPLGVSGADAVGPMSFIAGAGAERSIDSCNSAEVACGVSSDWEFPADSAPKLDRARVSGPIAGTDEDELADDSVAAASFMSSRGSSPSGISVCGNNVGTDVVPEEITSPVEAAELTTGAAAGVGPRPALPPIVAGPAIDSRAAIAELFALTWELAVPELVPADLRIGTAGTDVSWSGAIAAAANRVGITPESTESLGAAASIGRAVPIRISSGSSSASGASRSGVIGTRASPFAVLATLEDVPEPSVASTFRLA